jgi:hypothetical protein
MPEYQKKIVPFLHRGMNWNAPPDKIPEGQLAWCKNVRVLEQGTVSSAHGHTTLFDPFVGVSYLHSLSRLNLLNPDFNSFFTPTFVYGGDRRLYAGHDNTALHNPALNPVKTPADFSGANSFSGNPLSIVDAQPAGAAVAWKYIGDSQQTVTLGYYPTDTPGINMARAFTIGLTPPVTTTGITANPGGLLNGDYQWIFAYRRVQTGARSNPSAATRNTITQPATTLTNESATMTLPLTPLDPVTGTNDTNVVVDVYRFGGTVLRWALVGTGPGGSAFTDNLPDLQLLAAPSPPTATDPSTGLTRFNLFRPFVTQDVARSGTGVVSQPFGNGVWMLAWASGPAFNVDWLPGSTIYINGKAFTVYQLRDNADLEIAQDATGSLTPGQVVNWSLPAGTLTAGQPLPHLWGVYGVGQGASYLFACGDPNGPGTLYWTNGNDPDSTDVVNNIQVTSPSEKLQTGCIYNGKPYCWSTERQFEVFPSLTVFGQFTTQEIAGARGCLLEWSLSVQSNGLADQSVSWRGNDGIYDWSAGGGLRRMTDDLYPFFPHDDAPGIAPETIMPFIGANSANPENVGNLDDAQPKYHRTCWFQGMLFYDFVAQTTPQGNTFSTLVWDDVEVKGWVSLDQTWPGDTTQPQARGIQIGGNSLQVSHGGTVFDYFGYTRGFSTRVITPAFDQGDPRGYKLYGDYWLDCTPLAALAINPLTNYHRTSLALNVVAPSPTRGEYTLEFLDFVNNNGIGFLGPTLGLDIRWIAPDGQFGSSLNQWGPSFVPKPEPIGNRPSDRSDDGWPQAKFLRGMVLEANTEGVAYNLDILVDGSHIAQVTINHPGQTEIPYSWTPVAGYLFQVMMQWPEQANWQLYGVRWVWDKWPDFSGIQSPWLNLGTSKPKYIRSFTMPIAGPATPVSFQVTTDDGNWTTVSVTPDAPLIKTSVQFPFNPPILAHQVQLAPTTSTRAWYEEIVWDAEEWPELETMHGPWQAPGSSGAIYLRSLEVPVETGGVAASLSLLIDPNGASSPLGTVTTGALIKSVFPLVPAAPIVGHEFQIRSLNRCRVWWGEAKWDFEPWPELSTARSAFTDCGYKGAKFMQGLIVPLDTNGQPVSLRIDYDGGSVTVGPTTTPAGAKTPVAFSFSPCNAFPSDPFIAHELQITPLAPCRVWYEEIDWRWNPVPELAYTWDTQETTHDLPGYHYLRDGFIAYMGNGDIPRLTITTQYGALQYPLEYSNGVYVRLYRVLQAQKAPWRSYRVESCAGLRLFKKDCEVRAKAWGDTGTFRGFEPFGDLSRTDPARI